MADSHREHLQPLIGSEQTLVTLGDKARDHFLLVLYEKYSYYYHRYFLLGLLNISTQRISLKCDGSHLRIQNFSKRYFVDEDLMIIRTAQ